MACPLLRGIASSSFVLGATLAVALTAAGWLAPVAGAPAPRPAIKPTPPLDVRLEALDETLPGRAARFRLTVTPRVASEEIRVRWRPAPAVRALDSDTLVTRAARLGEEASFDFTVVVPASGRHALHAVVEVVTHDGRVWRRGAGVGLGPNPRAAAARHRPDGRGGEVVEYDAAPADQVADPR